MDAELLEILRCPHCGGHFVCQADALICKDPACRRKYAIRAGAIPNLLPAEAEQLEEEAWREAMGD
ncbi:Trm112 family protein [Candidatus Sumerlaeota bacterium]|nr:Trm112 family protein [Candidatus Sumerlaeota bacterium]